MTANKTAFLRPLIQALSY